jgi:Tfp pilus assembly protein PilF
MHVESVAWVSERKDVLYSLFFLAGLISYTRYVDRRSNKQYWLAVLWLTLSLLSKPAAVIFPVVLFCIDVLRERSLNYKLLLEKLPFFILALAMGLLTFVAQKEKGATEALNIFDTGTRLLMGFYGIMMYFIKLIFPVNLSPFYPFAPINEALPISYYISPLFSVLLIVLIFYSLKRNRVIAFGILFYLINLLLVLQFIPVGSAIIANRYTYIPYIGFFYIIGWLIDRYSKGVIIRSYYFNIPLALLLGALTFKQSMVWLDGASLWDQAIKTNPGARAYISRGDLYKEAKKYDLAIQSYTEAIKINIADQEAYTNRGNVYFELNNYEKALADYKKAHSIKPDYVTAIDNIGAIFGLQSKYDSALFYFNKALEVNPQYIASYRNRGLVNIELGRNEDAIKDFKKILEYDTNNPDVMNMVGVCYRNLGKYNDAMIIITEAIKIKPDPRFYLNRAYCYRDLKDLQSARKDVQLAKQGGLQIDATFEKSLE